MNIIDTIYVTSDDEGIKKMVQEFEVINRPTSLATDIADTVSVIKHVLETISTPVDNIILLQHTNPLRPETLLKKAYQRFLNSNCDSLITVTRNYQKFGKTINDKFIPFNYTMGQRS